MDTYVDYVKRMERWRARKFVNGKSVQSAYFKTESQAVQRTKEWQGLGVCAISDFGKMDEKEQYKLMLAYEAARNKGLDIYDVVMGHKSGAAGTMLISESVTAYLKSLSDRKTSHSHQRDSRQILRNLERVLPGGRVSALSEMVLSDFIYEDPAHSANTVANRRKIVHAFINWLVKKKEISVNTCAGVDKPVIGVSSVPYLRVPEVKKLMQACTEIDPKMVPYFAINLWGGTRPSEVAGYDGGKKGVTWSHVDMAERDIDIPDEVSKTVGRLAPMEDNLVAWLKAYRDGDLYPISKFEDRFRAVISKAGIEWKQDIMRHSYCSYYVAKFRDLGKLAYNIGHVGTLSVLRKHYENRRVKPKMANEYWDIFPITKKL